MQTPISSGIVQYLEDCGKYFNVRRWDFRNHDCCKALLPVTPLTAMIQFRSVWRHFFKADGRVLEFMCFCSTYTDGKMKKHERKHRRAGGSEEACLGQHKISQSVHEDACMIEIGKFPREAPKPIDGFSGHSSSFASRCIVGNLAARKASNFA